MVVGKQHDMDADADIWFTLLFPVEQYVLRIKYKSGDQNRVYTPAKSERNCATVPSCSLLHVNNMLLGHGS